MSSPYVLSHHMYTDCSEEPQQEDAERQQPVQDRRLHRSRYTCRQGGDAWRPRHFGVERRLILTAEASKVLYYPVFTTRTGLTDVSPLTLRISISRSVRSASCILARGKRYQYRPAEPQSQKGHALVNMQAAALQLEKIFSVRNLCPKYVSFSITPGQSPTLLRYL